MLELLSTSDPGRIHTQALLALALGSVYLGVVISRKMGLLAGALYVLAIVSSCWVACGPVSPHFFNGERFVVFSLNSLRDAMYLTMIACIAVSVRVDKALRFIQAVAFLNALALIWWKVGLFYNASADASFIATTLPLFWKDKGKWKLLSVIPIISILMAGSSTGLLAMTVAALLCFRVSLWMLMASFSLSLVGVPLLKHSLTNSNGRVELWTKTITFFRDPIHSQYWLTGFGTGSFRDYERSIWGNADGHYQLWIWPHNEFINVGFDQGPIGLILIVAIVATIIWKSRKTPWLMSAASTYAFTMMTQWPLRNMVTALYGALIIRVSRRKLV